MACSHTCPKEKGAPSAISSGDGFTIELSGAGAVPASLCHQKTIQSVPFKVTSGQVGQGGAGATQSQDTGTRS